MWVTFGPINGTTKCQMLRIFTQHTIDKCGLLSFSCAKWSAKVAKNVPLDDRPELKEPQRKNGSCPQNNSQETAVISRDSLNLFRKSPTTAKLFTIF